jgi:hypothetical protein
MPLASLGPGVKDIVEAALAAGSDRGGDDAEGDDEVTATAFAPPRIAVVGVGSRGRRRLTAVHGAAAAWSHGADQLHTGVAPVEAPPSAPLRAHPDGAATPDLEAADLVVATAHVHSGADVERCRRVARRARPDAVTVAVPTVTEDARATPTSVARDLLAAFDAAVPLGAERTRASSTAGAAGRGTEGDLLDDVAASVAVALLEGVPGGAHRPVTPHVPALSVLAGGGRGRAHLGIAGPEATLAELGRGALAEPLAHPRLGPADGVVSRVVADEGVTVSAADSFRDTVETAVAGRGSAEIPAGTGPPDVDDARARDVADDAGDVAHYAGVQPALAAGADRRAVVVVFDGA